MTDDTDTDTIEELSELYDRREEAEPGSRREETIDMMIDEREAELPDADKAQQLAELDAPEETVEFTADHDPAAGAASGASQYRMFDLSPADVVELADDGLDATGPHMVRQIDEEYRGNTLTRKLTLQSVDSL